MIIDLGGKTAIVTGSTGGIGLAIAEGLAKAGAEVTVVGREQSKVDAAAARVSAAHRDNKARGVVCDVGTVEGCQALIAVQPQADILINLRRAGILRH